jgi:hypothetical protein
MARNSINNYTYLDLSHARYGLKAEDSLPRSDRSDKSKK